MNALEYAIKNKDYLIQLRRHFHKNPELSFKEYNTSNKICEQLEKFNIPYVKVANTGVLVTINGKNKSPVIAFRADMDALPIKEINKQQYCSEEDGVMHACGHDAHIAIALTLVKFLSENRDKINGCVKIIFQPAEEIILGAVTMMKESPSFFKDIDNILGLHVWNGLETGKISVRDGAIMAAVDSFKVTIHGQSGHASAPHQTVDSIYIASNIISSLQAIISRECDPLQPVVISIGTINGGTARNIIANNVVFEGTVRYFDEQLKQFIPKRIEEIVKQITSAFNASYDFLYNNDAPALINEKKSTVIAEQSVINILGEQALVKLERVMGSEDFSHYLQTLSGCYAFIGTAYKQCFPHHHELFDIDENGLINAVAFAIEYLKLQNVLS